MKQYSGAGNTFLVLFDEEKVGSREEFTINNVGTCDGVIFVRSSSTGKPKFQIDFYNRDGSLADFCGNGSRCFLRFLYDNQKISLGEKVSFQTGYGILQGMMIQLDLATVEMPKPTKPDPIFVEGYHGFFLTVGVPHFVIFLDSQERLEQLPLTIIGSKIRNSSVFPEGANVNFITILDTDTLRIRTYERGVEGETMACGSGSTASAVAYTTQFQKHLSCVNVQTKGGLLTIHFEKNKIFCQGGVQCLKE